MTKTIDRTRTRNRKRSINDGKRMFLVFFLVLVSCSLHSSCFLFAIWTTSPLFPRAFFVLFSFSLSLTCQVYGLSVVLLMIIIFGLLFFSAIQIHNFRKNMLLLLPLSKAWVAQSVYTKSIVAAALPRGSCSSDYMTRIYWLYETNHATGRIAKKGFTYSAIQDTRN